MKDTKKVLKGTKTEIKYGKTHIIYGKGKGKTSSSVGMAARAAGNGLKVKYVQFMKSKGTGESKFLEKMDNVDYFCQENSSLVDIEKGMNKKQVGYIRRYLEEVKEVEEKYDMLIADEILNVPLFTQKNDDFRLTYKDIERIIRDKKDDLEIVLTGLFCNDSLMEKADYISEIKNVKHPYENGLEARKGIEF